MDQTQLERHGRCKLCRRVADLTKTHVPPRAADNSGIAQRGVEVLGDDGVRRYGLGRDTEGGMWGRWFCTRCNNRTGRWDEEYLRWREDLLPVLHDPRRPGGRVALRSEQLDPGAFARSLWAWMFALSDHLWHLHPEVGEGVLSGEPVDPPTDFRLMLALTRDVRSAIFVLSFSVNVTAPPFTASLVTIPLVEQIRAEFGETSYEHYIDIGDWLRLPADQLHPVELELRVVTTLDDDASLRPVGQPVFD